MNRAALLSLIGNAGFRMLTDLHFPNKLIDVTYDALIEYLERRTADKFQKWPLGYDLELFLKTRAKASTSS